MTADVDLELIPRSVRDMLDRVGIKLHLREWQLLNREERQHLCDLPCGTAAEVVRYRNEVDRLVLHYCGKHAEIMSDKV